ncbi:MAG: hypothetical protein A2176_12075 [Spirochaetes bacterium RBG_13_51_14]|nr:MAG: hypothetical protein A2176_12075 [Spirochaetes bacterium RBG_13_51_14]
MKKDIIARSALLALALFFVSSRLFSYSDQTTTERILKENKRFVEFINICVTNFAGDRKDDFKKIYEKHFNADVAYLQSDYKRAYKRVYSSQGDMEKLYRDMVKNYYLEDSKTILDRLAPGIIRSRNARARLYLTLGYRDRTVSWVHYTVGDASSPKLFSYKLYKFVDAIKMARRAKRYAFLALFESQTMETKKKIYNQLCKSERDMGNRFMNRFVDLNEQDYINEMTKSYAEHQSADAAGKKEGTAGGDRTFEMNVERRVRFRSEIRASRYLMNGEFDRAEDIMRQYIDDFNFKLICAAFDVLAAADKEGAAEKTDRVDYEKFKIHLMDNYSRFTKQSMMDGIIDIVTVEDDIAGKDEEEQGVDNSSGGGSNKGQGAVTPEKKDDKSQEKKEKNTSP